MDRREPERVDAEPGEIVELADDAAKVADPVAVRVREGAHVDLVDDRFAPPGAHCVVWQVISLIGFAFRPHFRPLRFAVPHLGEASAAARGAAQSPQNFAPSRLSLPQLGHFIF
jgi:hypothetical protein